MKRKFTLLLTILFTLFTLPVSGLTALAAEKDDQKYENGTHEIDLRILHEDNDEDSIMHGFLMEELTTVTIQEEAMTVEASFKNVSMIQNFKVEGNEVSTLDANEDEDTATYSFSVSSLDEIALGEVHVIVPGMYDQTHDIRLKFDTSNIPVVSEDETDEEIEDPEVPNEPDNEDESEDENNNEDNGNEDQEEGNENESDEDSDDAENETILENGSYTIDVSYLRSDSDSNSSMGNYLGDTVFLNVQDGKVEATITVNEHHTVTKLQVDGNNSIEAKLDGDKRYETFLIDDVSSTVNAYVEYQAPFGDDVFEGNADFRIDFDLDSVNEVDNTDHPGNGIEEVLIQLDDGLYTIDSSYFRTGTDDNSSMGSYLDDSVFVSAENGTYFLTITINEDETVTKLQVDGHDAVEKEVDGEKRYETFEINDLASLHSAYVEYQAPFGDEIFEGQANFDIALDPQSIHEAQESDKPGFKEEEPEEDEEEPKEEKDENTEGKENEDEPSALVPDKVYTIDYDIYDDKKENLSVANQFFTGKAKLLEKDGKTYAQLTITNGDMIKALSNEYGDAILVKENDDGSVVMQVRVDNELSDMLLDMHIVVPENAIPGFPGYDQEHGAYLVFDTDTKEEVDVGEHELAAIAGNENGPEVTEKESTGKVIGEENNDGGNGDDDQDKVEKPEFGTNGENGNGENGKNGVNPQTGDTSMIMFYALLLLGSLVPLAIQLKRRFAVK